MKIRRLNENDEYVNSEEYHVSRYLDVEIDDMCRDVLSAVEQKKFSEPQLRKLHVLCMNFYDRLERILSEVK